MSNDTEKNSVKRTGIALAGMAALMLGAAYAAVPLYDLFCRVTGFGGTPLQAEAGSDEVLDETVTVRFDASRAKNMPWEFKAAQRDMDIRIGETGLAFYTAHNPTDKPISGSATFNVTPLKIGAYFVKIDCFCFEEQTLQPGETVQMPVTFYVDPEIRKDPLTEEVANITLSYTFYRMDETEIQGEEETAPAIN